jgi:hypothetical protein
MILGTTSLAPIFLNEFLLEGLSIRLGWLPDRTQHAGAAARLYGVRPAEIRLSEISPAEVRLSEIR